MYHTGEGLSLHGEGEQALRSAQDTVGFTPHICKGNHDEGCGELTVKRLSKRHGKLILVPENHQYPPLAITEATAFEVWGVVTYVIHRVDRRPGGISP